MAIPGFRAETSLYQTSEPYKMVGAVEALAGSRMEVVPQQLQRCVTLGPCRFCLKVIGIPPRVCVTISCPTLGINRTIC
jgi:hypothetical protein